MADICIVDYGVGNIHSAHKAAKMFCSDTILSDKPSDIDASKAIILPGQGAFETGMNGLQSRGLIEPILKAANSGKPILGICIGAQILMTKGYEFGEFDGLNLIPGEVRLFPELDEGTKVPHMGWNEITPANSQSWEGTALENIDKNSDMYFIHSYIMKPENSEHVLAECQYGSHTFAAAIGKDNILGCQFHPEKSSVLGLKIIEKFASMI